MKFETNQVTNDLECSQGQTNSGANGGGAFWLSSLDQTEHLDLGKILMKEIHIYEIWKKSGDKWLSYRVLKWEWMDRRMEGWMDKPKIKELRKHFWRAQNYW